MLAIVCPIIEIEEVEVGVWEMVGAREVCVWGKDEEEGIMQTPERRFWSTKI